MSIYTWVYLQLYAWIYYLYKGIHTYIGVVVQIISFRVTFEYL